LEGLRVATGVSYAHIALGLAALAGLWFVWRASGTTVYEHQKGLLFYNGKFVRELGAGHHRRWSPHSTVQIFDLRSQPLAIKGQDVLTSDKINIRISMVGAFRMIDPRQAVTVSTDYLNDLQTSAQMALRHVVGQLSLADTLEKQSAINADVLSRTIATAKILGLEVPDLAIRDVTLPANLKRAFAGVIEAQKDAQRKLEIARGEHALLRTLSNASRLYAENPALLQARAMQALETGQNSIVLGVDGGFKVSPTPTT
jgi:regulator of protease activity HflC (stomatin/prohibitin superfamily)